VSVTTELLTGPADTPDATPATAGSPGEAPAAAVRPRRRSGTGLSSMLLPELQRLAQSLGISGTGRMRKSQLVEAIQERAILDEPVAAGRGLDQGSSVVAPARSSASHAPAGFPPGASDSNSAMRGAPAGVGDPRPDEQDVMQPDTFMSAWRDDTRRRDQQGRDQQGRDQQGRDQNAAAVSRGGEQEASRPDDDGDVSAAAAWTGTGSATVTARRDRPDGEPVVTEDDVDDVLIPIAGILDVLDNYAFVRTSGYLPGPHDVYVSLSQVRKYGLRKGDVIEGAVRQPRDGERREKFNALVRLDKVNGLHPEQSRGRPDFSELVPLYPQERLRLGDRAARADHADHRSRQPDRQGPARLDRVAAQGGQDDDPAGDRERDHQEQPGMPPHGRASG
jgi:transcription termination factor Rho